ncbi:hypothetical protein HaLaN_18292, partial [Haematococcus lacustris]
MDILQLDVDEQALDALLAEDVTQLLQREFGSTYPQMMGPLLHERSPAWASPGGTGGGKRSRGWSDLLPAAPIQEGLTYCRTHHAMYSRGSQTVPANADAAAVKGDAK